MKVYGAVYHKDEELFLVLSNNADYGSGFGFGLRKLGDKED